MKLTIIPRWMLLAGAAMMLVAGGLAGCSDDTVDPNGDSAPGPIKVTGIIVNPKSPAPGDTVQLTVIIESDSMNVGAFPTITWSAGGGSFLENGQMSVRWEAPDVSRLVTVSVSAKNSVNTASRSAVVFVAKKTDVVPGDAGQLFLTGATKDDFFYLRTSDISLGLEVYRYSNGTVADAATGGVGENLVISSSLNSAAFQRDVPPSLNEIEPIHVYYNDLVAGTETKVTTDKADPTSRRRQQYFNPELSNSGALLAYQGLRPALTAAGIDSMDIFVYDPATLKTVAVTGTHSGRHRNHLPTFSTDDQWLLFISNRADQGQPARWEYYGLRVSGAVVDTAMAQTVQITDTNSQLVNVTLDVVSPPVKAWNPVSPILAVVQTNFSLLQVTLGAQGGTSVTTPLLNRPRELVWSPDGSMLAFTDWAAAYTVPAGGTGATLIHQATSGSVLNDIVWSPDQSMIVYRITRGSGSWFELKPIGNPSAVPVVLTPSVSSGEAATYRRSMSLSPVWLAGDELLLLQFYGATPAIDLLNISAATD